MLITAFALMALLAVALPPLRQRWFLLHALLVIAMAAAIEHYHWLPAYPPFHTAALVWSVILHLICINLVTFIMYGWDKRQARRGGWRIPERVLHMHATLGATPAAFLGSKLYRHKTIKGPFRRTFLLVILLQLTAALLVFYFYPR